MKFWHEGSGAVGVFTLEWLLHDIDNQLHTPVLQASIFGAHIDILSSTSHGLQLQSSKR